MDSKKPLLLCVEETSGIKITESKTDKGTTYVARGLFAKADVETSNKRVYPSIVLDREIKKLQEDVKSRKVLGELDHPFDGKTKLSRASHIITNLEIDDKGNVFGEAEILDTINGKNLKAIIESGAQVGVSSRGFGTVKKSNGKNLVQDDFSLQTFDFVANPAQKEAYPKIFLEAEGASPEGINESLATIEEDFPHLYDEMKDRVRKELQSEVSEQVEKKVSEQRLLIEEETRKKLGSDASGEEGKKLVSVCEEIKKLVKPLLDDGKGDDNKDKKIEDLERDLAEATMYARVAGYNLFLERELKEEKKEDRDAIMSLVGEVKLYDKLDNLKEAVKSAKDKIKALSEGFQARESKQSAEIERLSDELSKTKSKLQTTESELRKANVISEVREKLADNPLVEEAVGRVEAGEDALDVIDEISQKVETDSLIESIESGRSRSGNGSREKVLALAESVRRPYEDKSRGKRNNSPIPVLNEDQLSRAIEMSRKMNGIRK